MTIRTFSGAHPYRPQCAAAAAREVFDEVLPDDASRLAVMVAERVTTDIDRGVCPRCHDPLIQLPAPEKWRPAGSRATRCRCIPVCDTCASWIEPILGPSAPTAWPTDIDVEYDGGPSRKEREAEFARNARANCTVAYLEQGTNGPVVITRDGIMPVVPRPNPGGWLEFGYDDTTDERERQS